MSSVDIRQIGITKLDTDAIVNAANEGLWEGSGVCGAIFHDAGSFEMTKACEKIGGCKTGNAVITPGFNLPAKYVIHAVGPKWTGGDNNEPKLLYSAYKQSLLLAKEYNLRSIGFPLISAGLYGYPADKAWRKAIQACIDFIQNNKDYDIDIVFAVIDFMNFIEGKKILGIVSREKDCIDYKKMRRFAEHYKALWQDESTKDCDIVDSFGADCFGLGFEMDGGKAFIDSYGYEALDKPDGLKKVIESIDDPMLLGSGLFSKWRGITHWSYESLLSDENRPWFIASLARLSEIIKREEV